MAEVAVTGIGIDLLYAYWEQTLRGDSASTEKIAWDLENTLLSGLELNVLETGRYLHEARPTYEAFEAWVLERNGGAIEETELDRLRRALAGETVASQAGSLEHVEGLSEDELAHWDEHGYVVVKGAVSAAEAEAAELAIYEHLGMEREDAESWYKPTLGYSIWVPVLHHPAIRANRRAPRVVKAFAQLWEREDLWPLIDQGGLNPPERPGKMFPGPHVHWDATLAEPHHFGVQGILYLNDVAEDQGAFCCVPGFHRELKGWLAALPQGVDPRVEALRTLTMKPIAAQRGDLVIWHQSLPHGASPNRAAQPRVVQYMTLRPTRWPYNAEWR